MAAAVAVLFVMACADNLAPIDDVKVNAQLVTSALLTLDPPTTLDGESMEVVGNTGPERYKTSFLAVQGKQTDFLIQYVVAQAPTTAQTVLQNALVLSIPAEALLVDPYGNVVPRGKAVEVVVHVLRDGDKVEATFGPEGLGFNGPEPAMIVTTSRETSDPDQPWAETFATTTAYRTIKLRRFSNYAVAF